MASSNSFLISDVRIFTGTDVIDLGYLVVKGGFITAVSSGKPPADAALTVLSKPGHTVLPGFIDSHIHANKGDEVALTQCLKFGVTTAMDMHNEENHVRKLKKLAADKLDLASDFKAAGCAVTMDGGWPKPVVLAHDKTPETLAEVETWPKLRTPSDATAYVTHNLSPAGCGDYSKLMHESGSVLGESLPLPSLDFQRAAIEATHAAGRVAVAHCFSRADTLQLLSVGINGMAHTFVDEPVNAEVLESYKKAGAWCNPTLALLASLTAEGKEEAEIFANDARVKGKLTEREHSTMCQCLGLAHGRGKVEHAYETVKALKAEGVPVIVGSDAAAPALGATWGATFHHEMHLLVHKCGFSPMEALHAGTALVASLFGWDDRGKIAEGLKADLVLIEGNPIEEIEASLNIRNVWRNGVPAKWFEETVKE